MRVLLPFVVLLPSIVLLFACSEDPCGQAEDTPPRCTGAIVIDLAAEEPAFRIEGLGATAPDKFVLWEPIDCTASVTLWEIGDLTPDGLEFMYGDAPADAALVQSAEPLVDGTLYVASFGASYALTGGTAAHADWSGTFIAGDPESFELGADCVR